MRHLKQLFAALLLLCTTLAAGAQSYNLKYKVDGKDYVTYSLSAGETISHPTAPVKEGHRFLGWSTSTSLELIDLASNADAMLYSNAPCKTDMYGDQFTTWDVLFDGKDNTFFHSDYSGQDSEDGLDHYLRVDMGEGNALSIFTFSYRNRDTNSSKNAPATIIVEGSNDADGEYEVIATLSALPSANSAVYESTLLGNGNAYRYIRFRVVATQLNEMQGGHPFFFISEFEMYQVAPAPATMPASDLTLYARFRMYNSDIEQGGIFYKFLDEEARTVVVTSCQSSFTGYSGALNIPATVTLNGEEYTVVGIEEGVLSAGNVTSVSVPGTFESLGARSFAGCKYLTSVTLANGIKSIGDAAFNGCTSLKELRIEDGEDELSLGYHTYSSNINIGKGLFYDCPLETLYLGRDLSYNANMHYGYSPFRNKTTLTFVTIGNSVTSIGDYAFCDCTGLTSIEIPNSVTRIGSSAFGYCTGLTSVVIPNSVTSIGGSAFSGCTGLTSIEIPNSVTSIGGSAFSGCTTITSVTIPNSVTSIGDYVFHYFTGLTNVVIGNSVTSIGNYAFSGCSDLTSVVIPNSVTSIGNYAFNDCTGLASIEIPNSVTSIGDYAFRGCTGLTSVEIPNSVTSIGNSAFRGCTGLTSVTVGNSVASIGNSAFYECSKLKTVINLSNLTFSKGSSDYGYIAYYADKVYNISDGFVENDFVLRKVEGVNTLVGYLGNKTELTLPADYNGENYAIGSSAFSGCTTITSVTIPNSVTSIGESAFYGCSGLTSIEIPNSVTRIGKYVFCGCTGLTSIVVDEDNTKYDSRENCNAIIETGNNTLVVGCKNTIIPNSITRIGNDAFRDCASLTSIEIPNSVTSIGSTVFYGCSGLTSIEIPNSVTSIGDYAFSGCTGLTSIEIPNSVTSIGGSAFSGCTGLTSVEIPNSVTSIGGSVFNGCTGLTSIEIPNSVTSIGGSAFRGCTGLTSVEIPNSVTSIGNSAFSGCTGLTSIEIPNSVTSIGGYAFSGCTGLTSIEIPNSVTSIEYSAFRDCTGLTSIEIGNSVTSIRNYAFYGCTGLTSIEIPNSVTSIENHAFYGCTALTSVTVGNSVASIGNSAFYECSKLKTVINLSNLTFSKGSTNYGCIARYADTIYSVPNGFVQGDFIFSRNESVNTLLYYLGNDTDLTLPYITSQYGSYVIGADVFKNNTTLTRVVISRSVVGFEELAFLGCTNLKTIVNFSELTLTAGSEDNGGVALYADKVVNAPGGDFVGDYVFTTADGVNTLVGYVGNNADVVLPESFNGQDYTIGATAFAGDTNITSLTIPTMVTAVQADAFLGCTSLNAVYIDDLAAWCNIDFQDVGNSNPLNNAHNLYVNGELLTELVIPDGITEIKDATFRGCNKITSLTIPEGVTSIGRYAFNTCTALTEVTFPESLTTLHRGAFSGCIALEVVVLPAAVTELEYSVFMACSSLADITSLATTPPAIVNGSFTNIAENATLYVPRDCGAAYAATEWSQIPNIVELAFNVVYKVNGEVYATDRIDYGAAVTPVADPEVLGYTFIEWDGLPDYMPRHDIEVNAVFEKNSDFITLNQTGTTVYTSHFALDFSEVEGLKAYAATGYDTATGEITMTRVKKVNAGVGVYLVGEVSATYAVPYIDYSTSYSLNMLVGVLNKTMVNSYSDDGIYANYRYVKKSGDTQFKFYQAGDGNTVSAGKAYLQIPVAWFGGMASETVGVRFDEGELTDIEEIYDEVEGIDGKVEIVYDLQGRVVENPTNGIYIINGKKVLIK